MHLINMNKYEEGANNFDISFTNNIDLMCDIRPLAHPINMKGAPMTLAFFLQIILTRQLL